MRWVTAVLQRHSTTDGLVTMFEEVPLGKTYEVDLDSIEVVQCDLDSPAAKAKGHTHHSKEIIWCKPRTVDGQVVHEYLFTEMLYIPGHNSKHIYTHKDKDGVLWRFEGGRPISKLADEVMDGLGFNQEK
jgi:hypothetical protein